MPLPNDFAAYPQLFPKFLDAMNDVGVYGFIKYGDNSFQAHALKGDTSRWMPRVSSQQLMDHAHQHFMLTFVHCA